MLARVNNTNNNNNYDRLTYFFTRVIIKYDVLMISSICVIYLV